MKTILFGVLFVAVGAGFCGAALYLRRPESVQKMPIAKPSGLIFYLIGALTLAMGVVMLALHAVLTKAAVQAMALIYLVVLIVIFIVFIQLLNGNGKK